jgi:MinD-like ATPase involved in chromosome partitioning or flagellar assembly
MHDFRLKDVSLSFIQLKGGVGKTLLIANLASIAAKLNGWTILLVDLDANAPLTGSVIGSYESNGTVCEALERVTHRKQVDDLLTFAPNMGFYLLKGDIRGIPADLIRWIPDLIHQLKQACVKTENGSKRVDCVLIDAPGENRNINTAILEGVDFVAMPLFISSPDLAAMSVTLQLISRMQSKRSGKPIFLGIIPNRISKKSAVDRLFLDVILKSGKILPYIPASDTVRGTFARQSRNGGEAVISFAPHSLASQRLILLWEALNQTENHDASYTDDFRQYLSAKPTSNSSLENDHAWK